MSDADREQLLLLLQARCAAIADRWYAAVARTSFTPHSAAQVRAELCALTEQALSALLGEPFAHEAAREVGAALARLHYLQPAALDGTLAALGQEIVAGLQPEQVVALHARLVALLGAVAAGFYAQSRALILEEQDQVRHALFVSRQEVEAAEEARAVAEAAARVRTDVLNAVAHDLRGPLTTILGQADLLRLRLGRDPLPTPHWLRARAEAVRVGANRMRAMVDELLDVARLQRGQALDLQRESLDVGAVVRDVAAAWQTDASGAAPVLIDAPADAVVDADRARLERVVDNLIGNALKYSPGGQPVHVTVQPRGTAVTISVRDQGVGIPADELPHLFTPFYRASTARGIPGIGLGLAGAKAIVEQHGGQIAVDSTVGGGTTVAITLPRTPPTRRRSSPQASNG